MNEGFFRKILLLGGALLLSLTVATQPALAVWPGWVDILRPKLVFVTNAFFDGDLGGLSGADEKCQEAADAAGLEGDYQAWLSDDFASPTTRWETISLAPYYLLGGAVVAASYGDLVDGVLNHSIVLTETAAPSHDGNAFFAVWTGTLPDGGGAPGEGNNCDNWTTNEGEGSIGKTGSLSGSWTEHGHTPCGATRHLYCFQQ